ncbi:MAG: hypothetical protein ABSA75_03800 [Candidatus Bathyarchaeia archaeon]|jgi:hypothetical protein
MKRLWIVLVVALLISSILLPVAIVEHQNQGIAQNSQVYFGVTFGGNTTSQAKLLIDKVKGYTNLFIVDSFTLDTLNETVNGTSLTEVCDYAVSQGLNIIVYFAYISQPGYPWQTKWVEDAKEMWGSKLLGIYFFDEPGGKQIDIGSWNSHPAVFANVTNYDEAANAYVNSIGSIQSMKDLKTLGLPAFTSDYALYWFDYLAGYNTVFAELGGTNETTKIQQIALCRGAANVQNKQWGAIITYSSPSPPYLENGTYMLPDMLTAYWAGAKYIIVFNYPTYPDTNPYGILSQDQFNAMENFWNKIHADQKSSFGTANGEAALVLPKDYGWGMRNPTDLIWGLWNSDSLSPIIWNDTNQLLKTYGLRLDIIYNDTQFNFTEKYSKIYYWNSSEINQNV